jgi:X-X-X-Leu-X-X-Gly heptad repeat protein
LGGRSDHPSRHFDELKANSDGLGRLSDGLGRLSDGLGRLSDGLGRLSDGLGRLSDGLGRLSDGLGRLSDGLRRHFDGLGRHFDDLERHFDDLERHFDDLGRHFDHLERHFDDLERHFDDLGRHFDEVEVAFPTMVMPKLPFYITLTLSMNLPSPNHRSPALRAPSPLLRGGERDGMRGGRTDPPPHASAAKRSIGGEWIQCPLLPSFARAGRCQIKKTARAEARAVVRGGLSRRA